MIKEHERIVLTTPLPKEGLEPGDVGTVVHVYKDGEAYEVEFFTRRSHCRGGDGGGSAVATGWQARHHPHPETLDRLGFQRYALKRAVGSKYLDRAVLGHWVISKNRQRTLASVIWREVWRLRPV